MGDLDRGGRGDDVGVVAAAEVGGEQRQHGAHALAPRFEQVPAGDVRDLVGEGDLGEQAGFDLVDARVDARGEATVLGG